MSSTNQTLSIVTMEVPNKPLPVRMRLASLRARPGRRTGRRRSLPAMAPAGPVVGLAGFALTLRRTR